MDRAGSSGLIRPFGYHPLQDGSAQVFCFNDFSVWVKLHTHLAFMSFLFQFFFLIDLNICTKTSPALHSVSRYSLSAQKTKGRQNWKRSSINVRPRHLTRVCDETRAAAGKH